MEAISTVITYASLPQMNVCSSRKSSGLEAVCGVSLSVKCSLSTRIPTDQVFRETSQIGVKSVVPNQAHNHPERLALSNFHEMLEGFEGLPDLVENGEAGIGISTHGKAFSEDFLRGEISLT